MPSGRVLERGDGRIVIASARDGAAGVRVAVRDSGPGVDETTRADMFRPFFTTKAEGKGTGLGLAVSSGIVENHGGHLTVESTPREGTTFTLTLPATDLLAGASDSRASA